MTEMLQKMYEKIDQINHRDPRMEAVDGEKVPKEWIYGIRMTHWLEKMNPDANDAVKIASRGQHIARWEIPRTQYPQGKAGYYQWRTSLYRFHGEKLAELMIEFDYPLELVQQVRHILLKKDMKTNPDTQCVEDVAALVFLSHYLEHFVQREDMTSEKLIPIIQKTWAKMSEPARRMAKNIPFNNEIDPIVNEALEQA
jgi:hypothetical protein